MMNVDKMTIEQLKKYAATLSWEKVARKEYNKIDWKNDSIDVIRQKIKNCIDSLVN